MNLHRFSLAMSSRAQKERALARGPFFIIPQRIVGAYFGSFA